MNRGSAYNAVVLGGGTAGLASAAAVAGLDGRVALIERDRMGGDCLNTGCVPSRALISSARLLDRIAAPKRGGSRGKTRPSTSSASSRVYASGGRKSRPRTRRSGSSRSASRSFAERLGSPPREVRVGERTLRAGHFVIATGSRPFVPPVPGLADVPFHTNETSSISSGCRGASSLGGGPIGRELGQAFAHLGAAATILQKGPRILPKEDADVAAALARRLESEGITVLVFAGIERVEGGGGGLRIC